MNRRLFALFLFLAATLPAFQWTNQKKSKPRDPNIRNVQGIVYLPDDTPAVGAVVLLKNLSTGQVRRFITAEKGSYNFQDLSTKIDYELRADFQSLASVTRTLSMYDKRLDAIVNLRLESGQSAGSGEKQKPDEEKKQ